MTVSVPSISPQLKGQINDANLRHTLQEQILAFHASHQVLLDEMKGTVNHIRETVDEVQVFLQERLTTLPSSQPRIRPSIPDNDSIFHGRGPLVAQLVRIPTSKLDGGKSAFSDQVGWAKHPRRSLSWRTLR